MTIETILILILKTIVANLKAIIAYIYAILNSSRRKIIGEILLVGSGVIVFFAIKLLLLWADWQMISYFLCIIFIFIWSAIKLSYFFLVTLEFIVRTTKRKQFSFGKFLLAVIYVLTLIQISFALDYFCILQNNPLAFHGIQTKDGILHNLFDCFYFSTITFATIGFGDISPSIISAKMLVMLESLSSVVFIVLIIANYSILKSSFEKGDLSIDHVEEIDNPLNKDS